MSSAKPLICCGKMEPQARAAKAAMLPEYDYIHVCIGIEQACSELPQLLTGSVPAYNKENVGTTDYSKPAVAVVFGGYTESEYEEIRRACAEKGSIPWVRVDLNQPTPPLGQGWAESVAARVKKHLAELEAGGKFGQAGEYVV